MGIKRSFTKGINLNRTIDDKSQQIIIEKRLKQINGSAVFVGIFRKAGFYPGTPISVAQVGAWQEFGTAPHGKNPGIDSRPWMRSTLETNLVKLTRMTKSLEFDIVVLRRPVKSALDEMGATLQFMFQARISTASSWAKPLAASTIRSKLRGGAVRGPVPLIHTARMLKAITFKSVVKG